MKKKQEKLQAKTQILNLLTSTFKSFQLLVLNKYSTC